MSLSLLLGLLACTNRPGDVTVEPAPEPVTLPADGVPTYTLGFEQADQHLVQVTADLPTGGAEALTLMMATWTPGSYLIREYARNVEGLEVPGVPGAIEKVDKNRWTVQTGGQDVVRVRYTVYCREMSVRSNFVDHDLGMLNGASTFLVDANALDRPVKVALELPEQWPKVATGLDPAEGAAHTFLARDFDELVDSPIVAGDLAIYDFEVEGVPHQLVNWGEAGVWDGERSARDVEAITKEQIAFWGTIPYQRYVYLNVISEAGGGLEHLDSTLMLTSRWKTRDDDAYAGWLGLVSHEFFHTWNVKRLRPKPLGPFDYEKEVYTEDLWIAEGFTSYYDDLLLVRAGLIDEDEWLSRMARNIERLQETEGRKVHPLSQSSRDAWIKYYRSDENSGNTTISYYTKGAVVAFLLDAEIRSQSAGTRSLDDVMRRAYARYGGDEGYTSEQFREVAAEVSKLDLTAFFERSVDSTEELDYSTALEFFGLRFAPEADAADSTDGPDEAETDGDSDEGSDSEDGPGWVGLHLNGSNRVTHLDRGTPAFDAGFNVDDEVLALDDFRVPDGGWSGRLALYEPGDEVRVLVSRRGALRTLDLTLGSRPRNAYVLERDPDAKPPNVEQRKRLLGID